MFKNETLYKKTQSTDRSEREWMPLKLRQRWTLDEHVLSNFGKKAFFTHLNFDYTRRMLDHLQKLIESNITEFQAWKKFLFQYLTFKISTFCVNLTNRTIRSMKYMISGPITYFHVYNKLRNMNKVTKLIRVDV